MYVYVMGGKFSFNLFLNTRKLLLHLMVAALSEYEGGLCTIIISKKARSTFKYYCEKI